MSELEFWVLTHNFSSWVLSNFDILSFFHNFSFLSCHIFCVTFHLFNLSHPEFLSFSTIWVFWILSKVYVFVFFSFATIWVYELCKNSTSFSFYGKKKTFWWQQLFCETVFVVPFVFCNTRLFLSYCVIGFIYKKNIGEKRVFLFAKKIQEKLTLTSFLWTFFVWFNSFGKQVFLLYKLCGKVTCLWTEFIAKKKIVFRKKFFKVLVWQKKLSL